MAYSPKVGDIVIANGLTGTFKVAAISDNALAQLQPFDVSKQQDFGKIIENIPHRAIHAFREDSGQAAARIVREATSERQKD